MNHSDLERWSWILWANPDDDQGDENLTQTWIIVIMSGDHEFYELPDDDQGDENLTQTWIIVIMSDNHEFYELTLATIKTIISSTRHES